MKTLLLALLAPLLLASSALADAVPRVINRIGTADYESSVAREGMNLVLYVYTATPLEAPASFEWSQDFAPVVAAPRTATYLILRNLKLSDAGFYTITWTSQNGAQHSASFVLAVGAFQRIALTPFAQRTALGTVLDPQFTGSRPLRTLWFRDGAEIPAARDALTLTADAPGIYWVRSWNLDPTLNINDPGSFWWGYTWDTFDGARFTWNATSATSWTQVVP